MRKRIRNPRLTASRRRRRSDEGIPRLTASRGRRRVASVLGQDAPATPRGGVSLIEVLMSILCMGIGVVAVASLFPIALLRSVQATQLTSATVLRYNAETLIDINPNILFDPDSNSIFVEHFNRNYLVDPLGQNIFGTNNVGNLPRFNLGITNVGQAANLVTLPDSWIDWHDAQLETPLAPLTNADWQYVDVPASLIGSADLQEIFDSLPPADGTAQPALYQRNNTPRTETEAPVRVVLFDSSGRLSEVRNLVNQEFIEPGNLRIKWPITKLLPANNRYNTVSRVRLQYGERRYTWLLTVRNDTPVTTVDPAAASARVDVAVFFRRAFDPEDEIPYRLTGSGRSYIVSKINPNDPDPFLKRGGFMLNTDTGTWHRLQKINESTGRITLERNTKTLNNTAAVFMRGVVEVYPIGSKP